MWFEVGRVEVKFSSGIGIDDCSNIFRSIFPSFQSFHNRNIFFRMFFYRRRVLVHGISKETRKIIIHRMYHSGNCLGLKEKHQNFFPRLQFLLTLFFFRGTSPSPSSALLPSSLYPFSPPKCRRPSSGLLLTTPSSMPCSASLLSSLFCLEEVSLLRLLALRCK